MTDKEQIIEKKRALAESELDQLKVQARTYMDNQEDKTVLDAVAQGFVQSTNSMYNLFRGRDVTVTTLIRVCNYIGLKVYLLTPSERKVIDEMRGKGS